MDTSTQFIFYSYWAHLIFIMGLVTLILYHYYIVKTQKDFFILATRLRKVTPYYHSINFIVAYTGAILSAFTWDFNPIVILMIPISLFLMISEIKVYKKRRVILLKDITLQADFRLFALKIYRLQLIAIGMMYVVAKVL